MRSHSIELVFCFDGLKSGCCYTNAFHSPFPKRLPCGIQPCRCHVFRRVKQAGRGIGRKSGRKTFQRLIEEGVKNPQLYTIRLPG